MDELIFRILQQHRAGIEPPKGTIVASEPNLDGGSRPGGHRRGRGVPEARPVIGMHLLEPSQPELGGCRNACIPDPLLVQKVAPAISLARPHELLARTRT
jgi:hypothetical protein